jgi:hypothetical protein
MNVKIIVFWDAALWVPVNAVTQELRGPSSEHTTSPTGPLGVPLLLLFSISITSFSQAAYYFSTREVEAANSLDMLVKFLSDCKKSQPTRQKCSWLYRVSQEERLIFWEVIVLVVLSKHMYMYKCPIPNGFRDRTIVLYSSKTDKKAILRTVSNTGIY